MKYSHLKYFLYLCLAGNFIVSNSNEAFLQPEAHESSLHDKVISREPRALMLKDMIKKRGVSIEIDGVFYESIALAGRKLRHQRKTIRSRCLSDKFPNYKIISPRVVHARKECPKCGKIKPLKEFSKDNSRKGGFCYKCKECCKIYYQDNKEAINKSSREWAKDNPGYYKSRPIEVKDEINRKQRERRKANVVLRINRVMSHAVWRSLKSSKNGAPWESLVGWTAEEGRVHLESRFTEGMNWDNYGYGKDKWNIDHIIAICHWSITSNACQEFKDCWSLDNLQPLWQTRNFEKGNKPMEPKYLIKPF